MLRMPWIGDEQGVGWPDGMFGFSALMQRRAFHAAGSLMCRTHFNYHDTFDERGNHIRHLTNVGEATVLCQQRIGIMAKGNLRCLGNVLHLKNRYSSAFRISVTLKPHLSIEERTGTIAKVEALLPQGWKKVDSFSSRLSYEFPLDKDVLRRLFNALTPTDEPRLDSKASTIGPWPKLVLKMCSCGLSMKRM